MIITHIQSEHQKGATAGEPIEECQLITRRSGKMYVCQKGEAVYGWAIAFYRDNDQVRFQRRGAAVTQMVEIVGEVKDGDYLYPANKGKVQAEPEGQQPIGIAEESAKCGGWIDALLF